MTITQSKTERKVTIYLDGPEGNAFNLIGIAVSLAKQCCFSNNEIKSLRDDLMSSDYVHLVKTIESTFGTVVDLVTNTPEKYQ